MPRSAARLRSVVLLLTACATSVLGPATSRDSGANPAQGLLVLPVDAGQTLAAWARRFQPIDRRHIGREGYMLGAGGYDALITATGIWLAHDRGPRSPYGLVASAAADTTRPLAAAAIDGTHVAFKGARETAALTPVKPFPGTSAYFTAEDPARWRQQVPGFAEVRARQLYDGIDAVFYTRDERLEIDFLVSPGADPAAIRLTVDRGTALTMEGSGALRAGDLAMPAPVAYQEVAGERRVVSAHYRLHGSSEASIALGEYDHTRPLVIDPIIDYQLSVTCCSRGFYVPVLRAMATDAAGDMYFVVDDEAWGNSAHFWTRIVKLASDGSAILWDARVWGTAWDYHNPDYVGYPWLGLAYIAVDATGGVYVAGSSSNLNLTGILTGTGYRYRTDLASGAFVEKLHQTGTSVQVDYRAYFGGTIPGGLSVDASGQALISGAASHFPQRNATQPGYGGGSTDGVLARLTSDGTDLVFSTYVGGSGTDAIDDIAEDATSIYAAATTDSPDFPVTAGANPGTGGLDAVAMKLDAATAVAAHARVLGGAADDGGRGVAAASDGSWYVAGTTESADFPVQSAARGTKGDGRHGFLTHLAADGTLVFSTFTEAIVLAESCRWPWPLPAASVVCDPAQAIATDAADRAVIAHSTTTLERYTPTGVNDFSYPLAEGARVTAVATAANDRVRIAGNALNTFPAQNLIDYPDLLPSAYNGFVVSLLPGTCTGSAPGPAWVCINDGWVPPDHPLALGSGGGSGGGTTGGSTACTTVKPATDWVCVNGGWVPPNHPLATGGGSTGGGSTGSTGGTTSCTTVKPGATWVCVNGGWVPPDHPLARGGH